MFEFLWTYPTQSALDIMDGTRAYQSQSHDGYHVIVVPRCLTAVSQWDCGSTYPILFYPIRVVRASSHALHLGLGPQQSASRNDRNSSSTILTGKGGDQRSARNICPSVGRPSLVRRLGVNDASNSDVAGGSLHLLSKRSRVEDARPSACFIDFRKSFCGHSPQGALFSVAMF